MPTLQIEISEDDFRRLGLPKNEMPFEEFKRYLALAQLPSALHQAQQASHVSGLDQMTLAEIDREIRAVCNDD
jgi:hypothetical protein